MLTNFDLVLWYDNWLAYTDHIRFQSFVASSDMCFFVHYCLGDYQNCLLRSTVLLRLRPRCPLEMVWHIFAETLRKKRAYKFARVDASTKACIFHICNDMRLKWELFTNEHRHVSWSRLSHRRLINCVRVHVPRPNCDRDRMLIPCVQNYVLCVFSGKMTHLFSVRVGGPCQLFRHLMRTLIITQPVS